MYACSSLESRDQRRHSPPTRRNAYASRRTETSLSLSLRGKRRKDRGEDRKKGKKRIGIGVGEEREGERVERMRARGGEKALGQSGRMGYGTRHTPS